MMKKSSRIYNGKEITKNCKICGKKMTPKNVYGGFMGFLYRILFFREAKREYTTFSSCQECRDLFLRFTPHEVLKMRDKSYLESVLKLEDKGIHLNKDGCMQNENSV